MARHWPHCYDDDGKLDCCCGLEAFDADRISGQASLYVDDYGDPLLDREPMGGDPAWRERDL